MDSERVERCSRTAASTPGSHLLRNTTSTGGRQVTVFRERRRRGIPDTCVAQCRTLHLNISATAGRGADSIVFAMAHFIAGRWRVRRTRGLGRFVPACLLIVPVGTSGQGIRLSGVSSAQIVELRPLLVNPIGIEYSGSRVSAAPFCRINARRVGLGEGFSLHGNVRVRPTASDGYLPAREPACRCPMFTPSSMPILACTARTSVGGRWARRLRLRWRDLLLRRVAHDEGWEGAPWRPVCSRPTPARNLSGRNASPAQDGYLFGARARSSQ